MTRRWLLALYALRWAGSVSLATLVALVLIDRNAWTIGGTDLTTLGTPGVIPRFIDQARIADSALHDDGAKVTSTEPLFAPAINGVIYVTTFTDAAIQAAIAAAPDGGEVDLVANGTYVLNAALPIVVGKNITIDCHGWGTRLEVAAAVGATTDVFQLKPAPATTVQGMTIRGCYITPQSGTPARNGWTVDGTDGAIGYLHMSHVRVDQLGGFAFAVRNASGLVTGSPYNSVIDDASYLAGGADFTNAGDTVEISGSTILTGTGSLIIDTKSALIANDFGAHAFLLDHVTSTVSGGIIVRQATQGAIRNCNFEAVVASTEPNNCLLDLQGLTIEGVNGLNGFLVEDNYIGANALFVGCGIRVDRATQTQIANNYVAQGSVNSYTITANADRTRLSFNVQAPDNAISTYLSDSGTLTSMAYWQPTTHQISNYGAPINMPQLAIGTTLDTGAILDVKSQDATGGNEPGAWDTQWSCFGLCDGPTGKGLGIAANSVLGIFMTALAPGLAYQHLIVNALDVKFQASHSDVFSITAGLVNLINGAGMHDATSVVTIACGGAGATLTGGKNFATLTPGAGVTTCTVTEPTTIVGCNVSGQSHYTGYSFAGAVLSITTPVAGELVGIHCWY